MPLTSGWKQALGGIQVLAIQVRSRDTKKLAILAGVRELCSKRKPMCCTTHSVCMALYYTRRRNYSALGCCIRFVIILQIFTRVYKRGTCSSNYTIGSDLATRPIDHYSILLSYRRVNERASVANGLC
jgi:hypothetical protein